MIWLGEILAGEAVPIRAQFHDDTGTAADPEAPFARMETGVNTFTGLMTPIKIDGKLGYYGMNIFTTGYAEGIRTVRIGGTVATDKVVAAVYGFRVVAARAETATQASVWTDEKAAFVDESIESRNAVAPATPGDVTNTETAVLAAIDAKPVTPATDISEVSSVVELLAKYMKNELQRLDNGDGTITVTLLDDDDLTPLLTWTYQVATTTREKAV